jgi:membrane protease YdiL (CAAX protease family)
MIFSCYSERRKELPYLRAKLSEFADMSEFDLIPRERPASTSIFFILVATLAGFILIGPAIGLLFATPFMQGTLVEFGSGINHPLLHPEIKTPLFIIQGWATLGMAMCPLLYWSIIEKRRVNDFFRHKTTSALTLILTAMVVFFFILPNSALTEWNAHLAFPDFLKDLEIWAKGREESAKELTTFFTTFRSPGEFLFGFFVIAVLPGIGEELVFRGMLQPQLQRATSNIHVAICISAFLFSSLHMQFFGFVPRLCLGALFGYLYYWSGNLIVPMMAHFINNGFSVIMLYLHQLGKIDIDVESTEAAPWPAVITGTILTLALLVYLKILFERNRNPA